VKWISFTSDTNRIPTSIRRIALKDCPEKGEHDVAEQETEKDIIEYCPGARGEGCKTAVEKAY
jgi:hypothetical protein